MTYSSSERTGLRPELWCDTSEAVNVRCGTQSLKYYNIFEQYSTTRENIDYI